MAIRILVADDDPLVVELIEFKLTSRGYDVRAIIRPLARSWRVTWLPGGVPRK